MDGVIHIMKSALKKNKSLSVNLLKREAEDIPLPLRVFLLIVTTESDEIISNVLPVEICDENGV